MKPIIRCCLIMTFLAVVSCDYFSYRESVSPIINTDLPSSCAVGETISFNVFHVVFNGCGRYSRQETIKDGNVVTIKFYGKYPNGKICPDNIPTLETYYYFTAKEKGDYFFKFYQGNYDGYEYLLDTLRVQ